MMEQGITVHSLRDICVDLTCVCNSLMLPSHLKAYGRTLTSLSLRFLDMAQMVLVH